MLPLAMTAKKLRSWACYDCGKCTATCPVARAGGNTTPRRHVLSANLGQTGPMLNDGSLFSCLTCALCDVRCPTQVGYTELVQKLREVAFQEGIQPECPHGGALQSLMRMMAKGGTQQNRVSWLTKETKVVPAQGDVLFWVGCAPYFDAFFTELEVDTLAGVRAAVRLLNHVGVTPVVSAAERCCGHDLLWNGDRASFEQLAQHNVELIKASGAKTVVTSCAECLRTLKVDYEPLFGAKPPRMMHFSELLAEHLPQLKLKANGSRTVTFQDPCRLGRHLGIYAPPRQALTAVPGVSLVEMQRSGTRGVCCAGGTWSHCDRFSKRIQVERLREARASGATTLVTACPKCQIHFHCAMKDPKLGDEIAVEIRDVAEIVAERLA